MKCGLFSHLGSSGIDGRTGDDGMLSCELCKGVWGTASIVDVAGIQVKDGLVAQETLLVALRGRGQKNRTPGDSRVKA